MKTNIHNQRYLKGKLVALTLLGAFIMTPAQVSAQDDEDHNQRVVYQRLLNKFDHNGDGTLTGREAYQARKFYTRWKNSQDGSADRPTQRRPDVVGSNARIDRVRTGVDSTRDIRVRPVQRPARPANRVPTRNTR